jgi:hypothetical protein
MRCYFMTEGHIADIKMFSGLSDQDAIAKAHMLFSERGRRFDGFEVWDRARVLIRRPDPFAAQSLRPE